VADNKASRATLYNSTGVKQALVVTMPTLSAAVTGDVFNGTTSFNDDLFLFASENGSIAGWRGALGTSAETLINVSGAVYTGLAISTAKDTLYAANFANATVDLFDSAHSSPIGSFSDPNQPAGYAPFNIQNINGTFYVMFAQVDATTHDQITGTGKGFIDTFDPTTHNFTRLITGSSAGGTIGALNAPWGVAVAPSTFGDFASDLLIGNFGDGKINAFNPTTGAFLGTLTDTNGNVITNPGLWGLTFGNGVSAGDPNSLYLVAGGANEDQGTLARISVPEPATIALISVGGAIVLLRRRRTDST
jgi:uncharacterized protein (TIGR03118 family)